MKIKFIFIAVIVFCSNNIQAQENDSTKTKQAVIVSHFNEITGKFSECKDTLQRVNYALSVVKTQNKRSMDSILILNKRLKYIHSIAIQQAKKNLISKYGSKKNTGAYQKNQTKDFKRNFFLKSYFNDKNSIQIYFGVDQFTISFDLYRKEINQLVVLWKTDKTKMIIINGYSDNIGSEKYNLLLSKKRSNFVKNYLIREYELPKSSIQINYYGIYGDKRVNENDLDFLNRRVGIRLSEIEK